MSKEIGGKFINIQFRQNGTEDEFKTLVCTEDSQFQLTNEVSTKRTNCGPKTSVSEPTAVASGNAVQNIVPTASEVSYQDVVDWQKNMTKLDYRYFNSADTANSIAEGDAIEHIGSGFFTDSTYTGSAEGNEGATFSWSFTTTGVLGEYDDES